MTKTIYTIGHSSHSIETFISFLEKRHVEFLCDVRSRPMSRYNPQFNKNELKESLAKSGIKYVFLGKELGARSEDPGCYLEGKVQYHLLEKTASFRKGIERIKTGAKDYVLSLMCAENEPNDCHRSILVSRALEREGFHVEHILGDGSVEDHAHSIDRLVCDLQLSTFDIFSGGADLTQKAYLLQSEKIAYSKPTKETTLRQRYPREA